MAPRTRIGAHRIEGRAFAIIVTAIAVVLGVYVGTVAAQSCPSTVRFEANPVNLDLDLDVGWTGLFHDQDFVGLVLTMGLSCTPSGGSCGNCTLNGPIQNAGPGVPLIDNQRCACDTSIRCTSNGNCPGSCPCRFFFGAPLPVAGGGVGVCVVSEITGAVSGLMNPDTGFAQLSMPLKPNVYLAASDHAPCPTCVGDATENDGIRAGTCSAGARAGQSCDVHATTRYPSTWGKVSYDCPPTAATFIGESVLAPIENFSTEALQMTLSAASPNCTASGATSLKCFCDTCNNASAQPCSSNADCPPDALSNPGVCGDLRCLAGSSANVGSPCTPAGASNSFCGGGLNDRCGRPGEPTAPNQCAGFNCVSDPTDHDSIDEGSCLSPVDMTCSVDEYHPCVSPAIGCTPPQTCVFPILRQCYNDNGLIAGKVFATGRRSVPFAGTFGATANLTWGALQCLAPTTSNIVNAIAGLPGLGRISVYGPTPTPTDTATPTPTPTPACTPDPADCGNGVREGIEECDFGNGAGGHNGALNGVDKCTTDCTCIHPTGQDLDCDGVDDGCDNCVGVACPSVGHDPAYNPDQRNTDCAPNGTVDGCLDGGDVCDPCPAVVGTALCDPLLSGGINAGPTTQTVLSRGPNPSTRPPNGMITITVPQFALCADTTISVTNNRGPEDAFAIRASKYALRPKGLHFLVPATVVIKWDDREDDGDVNDGVCNNDPSLTCDQTSDCSSVGGGCSGSGPHESDLMWQRNNEPFSKEGFHLPCNNSGSNSTVPCQCPAHDPLGTSTNCPPGGPGAKADCSGGVAGAGSGCATVALECSQHDNSWGFETCDFSSMVFGEAAADLIPGGGKPASDCYMEWVVENPFNSPEFDKKGLLSRTQTCRDGDPACDADGSVDGRCTFRVGLCFNNDDRRLVKAGTPVCAAADVATWELKKPRPTSANPDESANALALRSAIAGLGASSVSGAKQQLLTFAPALTAGPACSPLVPITVPINGPRGRATLGAQATTTVAPGARRGVRDNDRLKLVCLPP